MLASECIARIQELIEVAGNDVEICTLIRADKSIYDTYEPAYFELTNVKAIKNPKDIALYECLDDGNDQQIITVF